MAALLNIVLVEDHDGLREVMVAILSGHGHHVVGLDCAEALDDEVGSRPIDILIVDLNLPGEDGFSLTQRVRRAHPLAGIIMVSARHELADKVTGYGVGADIYLPKPVAPDELIAAVNSIARRLSAQSMHIDAGNSIYLQLHTRKLRLSSPIGEVSLTDTEAAILTALARAPGQRLDIWQLLELLAIDMDRFNKSSFEVKIVRLRKKLVRVGADKSSLRVLRLSGYVLSVPLQVY